VRTRYASRLQDQTHPSAFSVGGSLSFTPFAGKKTELKVRGCLTQLIGQKRET